MKSFLPLLALAVAATAPLALAATQETAKTTAAAASVADKAPTDAEIIAAQLPSYPAGPCLVSGEEMGGDHGEIIDVVQEGRLFRLCCKSCIKMLAKSPEEYMAALDAAVIKEQLPTYPLDTCAVSGEKLGGADMGEPVNLVVGTRLVRLCCNDCAKKVKADPAKALAKVDAALIEQQSKDYPLDTCPISGEKLGGMGEPINYLYGTHLVKLCCKGCVKGVQKKPAEVLAKLAAARTGSR